MVRTALLFWANDWIKLLFSRHNRLWRGCRTRYRCGDQRWLDCPKSSTPRIKSSWRFYRCLNRRSDHEGCRWTMYVLQFIKKSVKLIAHLYIQTQIACSHLDLNIGWPCEAIMQICAWRAWVVRVKRYQTSVGLFYRTRKQCSPKLYPHWNHVFCPHRYVLFAYLTRCYWRKTEMGVVRHPYGLWRDQAKVLMG